MVMESFDRFGHLGQKNRPKVLLSMLNGKNEIVAGIVLHQLLRLIKEECTDSSLSDSLFELGNQDMCWMCVVKEKLFKELWKVCHGKAKIIAPSEELLPESNKSALSNLNEKEPPSLDMIWKMVKNASDIENAEGNTTVRCTLSDTEHKNGTRLLPWHEKMDETDREDWKTLHVAVAESLLKYSSESLYTGGILEATEAPGMCTFVVESDLMHDKLKSQISSYYINKLHNEEEIINQVKLQICCKCLRQISFDVHSLEEKDGTIHSVSQLVNHVIASLYVIANDFPSKGAGAESKESNSEQKSKDLHSVESHDHVTVTVMCEKSDQRNNSTLISNPNATSTIQSAKPTCSIGPPITVSLSSCIFTNTPTVKNSVVCGNKIEPRIPKLDESRISKLTTVVPSSDEQRLPAQTKPFVKLSGKNGTKFPVVTIVGKNGFLTRTQPLNNVSSLPGLLSNFKQQSPTKKIPLNVNQKSPVHRFTVTTIDKSSDTGGTKRSKYVVKMLRPENGKALQGITTDKRFVRVISTRKVSSTFSAATISAKANVDGLQDCTTQTKISSAVKLNNKTNLRKRDKQIMDVVATSTGDNEFKQASIPTTSTMRKKTPIISPSKAKINERTDLVQADTKTVEQDPLVDSNKTPRVKTPSKRKTNDQGTPMKKIVYDFLTSSSVEKIEQSKAMPYNAKRHSRRRRRQVSANKIIPIPYESHYLCIYETLAKKGWKAYWFRKCRCARSRKKKMADKPTSSKSSVTVKEENVFGETSKDQTPPKKAAEKRRISLTRDEIPKKLHKTNHDVTSPAVRPSCGLLNISNNSSKLQDVALLKFKTEVNTIAETPTEPTPVETVGERTMEVFDKIKQNLICREDEQSSQHIGTEPKACNFNRQVYKKELISRRKKVESVYKSILKERNKKEKDVLDLQRTRTPCAYVMQPYVFAQSFQEVDKQPSCLDVISVHSTVLQSIPDLHKKAAEIEHIRNSRSELLLNDSQKNKLCSSPSNVDVTNDLKSIWEFGRSKEFFEEKKKESLQKRKKTFLEKRKKTVLAKRKKISYKQNKKVLLGKVSRKSIAKPSGARSLLKRSLRNFGSKVYRHHSQRPKAPKVYRFQRSEQLEDEVVVPVFSEKVCVKPWNVPHTSVSEVVRKLEHLWCEEKIFCGFIGLHPDKINCGAVALTHDQISHALTALKTNIDMYTFSSKKKDGKNTVLLISRKLVCSPEADSQQALEKAPLGSETSCASPVLTKPRKKSEDQQMDTDFEPDSPKLLLKLRKTGEVSGSAIYSVPIQPACNEESSQSTCYDETTSSQCSDVINTAVSSKDSEVSPNGENVPMPTTEEGLSFNQNYSDCTSQDIKADMNFSNISSNNTDDQVPPLTDPGVNTMPLLLTPSIQTSQNDNGFDTAFNEIDCDPPREGHEFLSSTLISSSPGKTSPSFDLSQRHSPVQYVSIDGNESSGPKSFCHTEKNDIKAVTWTKEILCDDYLEELLQNITLTSLDTLEKIFIFDQKVAILPFELLQAIKADLSMSTHVQVTTNFTETKLKQPAFWERRRYPCIANGSFTCSRNSSTIHHNIHFSSFDSPETVRGMSHSKKSDDGNSGEKPRPCTSDESEGEFQPSPSLTLSSASHIGQQHSPQIRACNVLLRPLEGVFQDFKKDDPGKFDNFDSSLSNSEMNLHSTIKEPSARELNRLLKNQALNGSYWKPLELDPISGACGSHWRLRDRRKRTHDESISAESDNLPPDELITFETPAKTESVVDQRKLKKNWYMKYSTSPEKSLCKFANALWKSGVTNTPHESSNLEHKRKKSKALNCEAFSSLFANDIDLPQVRKWILHGTLSHPRPLRSPFLFVRRNTAKSLSKSNHRNTSEASTFINEEPVRITKKTPKGKEVPSIKRSKSTSQNEIFEELRRSLFKSRHPDYKGDLCNTSDKGILTKTTVSPRKPLSLLRVNADEAKNQDCVSLTSEILVEADRKHLAYNKETLKSKLLVECKNEAQSKGRRLTVSVRQNISEEMITDNNRNVESSLPKSPHSNTSLMEVTAPVALSSRGRALKPSLRNRSPNLPLSKKLKKSIILPSTSSSKKTPQSLKSKSEQNQSTPPRYREKRCFVHKHSTSGAYIKKVLDSGVYDV